MSVTYLWELLPAHIQDAVAPPDDEGKSIIGGREVRLLWSSEGILVADGPLRQPLFDYVTLSERNEEYVSDRQDSCLHEIPEEARMSFEDVFPNNRKEAMRVAVMEAKAREEFARQTLSHSSKKPPLPTRPPQSLPIAAGSPWMMTRELLAPTVLYRPPKHGPSRLAPAHLPSVSLSPMRWSSPSETTSGSHLFSGPPCHPSSTSRARVRTISPPQFRTESCKETASPPPGLTECWKETVSGAPSLDEKLENTGGSHLFTVSPCRSSSASRARVRAFSPPPFRKDSCQAPASPPPRTPTLEGIPFLGKPAPEGKKTIFEKVLERNLFLKDSWRNAASPPPPRKGSRKAASPPSVPRLLWGAEVLLPLRESESTPPPPRHVARLPDSDDEVSREEETLKGEASSGCSDPPRAEGPGDVDERNGVGGAGSPSPRRPGPSAPSSGGEGDAVAERAPTKWKIRAEEQLRERSASMYKKEADKFRRMSQKAKDRTIAAETALDAERQKTRELQSTNDKLRRQLRTLERRLDVQGNEQNLVRDRDRQITVLEERMEVIWKMLDESLLEKSRLMDKLRR